MKEEKKKLINDDTLSAKHLIFEKKNLYSSDYSKEKKNLCTSFKQHS